MSHWLSPTRENRVGEITPVFREKASLTEALRDFFCCFNIYRVHTAGKEQAVRSAGFTDTNVFM